MQETGYPLQSNQGESVHSGWCCEVEVPPFCTLQPKAPQGSRTPLPAAPRKIPAHGADQELQLFLSRGGQLLLPPPGLLSPIQLHLQGLVRVRVWVCVCLGLCPPPSSLLAQTLAFILSTSSSAALSCRARCKMACSCLWDVTCSCSSAT